MIFELFHYVVEMKKNLFVLINLIITNRFHKKKFIKKNSKGPITGVKFCNVRIKTMKILFQLTMCFYSDTTVKISL
jgi:hypothetical protein